ncbi:ABC transporter substrate-binding protein [Caldilinea sp.]|uniref:ABC transporter substrate-binding protein n=1 Tax=Caldilinea sp. TaxID=2293560 RepID=UPI0021DB8F93|nr:ABC transporter substrate-binding protein [Caldilinea sp.]GIV69990.1 MAG: peptide ABC transporter substrate-binding protein [Caldilinea sp.]
MKLLKIVALLMILSLLLAACAPGPEAPAAQAPAEQPAAAPAAEVVKEAPSLAAAVAAGTLPPLEERLPKVPFVVGPGVLLTEEDLPDWRPGRYGGTLNSAHSVADWAPDVFVMLNEPLLSAPGIGVQGIRGNVLESFEVSDDNTVFTFKLREGLKWSDGTPVTMEDVRFTWENIYGNEKLFPQGVPARFRTGYDPAGDPMTLEILDDYTFRLTSTAPYGGFLRNITIEGWNGYTVLINPSHVLKKWHPDFTPIEEMQEELQANNLTDEWWQLFRQQKWCENWHVTADRCIGYPTLNPWISVRSETPGVKVFDRNPYYWKVDTEGKQLPYIDRIVSVQVEDVEMVNQRVLAGDVDFLRESTALVKVPLYKENEARGGFRTILLDMHVDSSILYFNMTYNDETWRKVTQDLRFRQAVSLAIDRDEIIESVYYGFASKPLVSVGEEFSQYDVARANALLDEMGMTERDANGFRMVDGKPFVILVEHAAHAPDIAPVAELLSEQLKDVGLNLQVKRIDPQLWDQRILANEMQATVFWGHDQGWDSDYSGSEGAANRSFRLWSLWHLTNGAEGEEPPQWVKDMYALDAARWSAVSGSDEYNRLKEETYAWVRANLPRITVVEKVKYPMIANKDLRNVASAGYAIASNFAGEQLWFDR